MNDAERIESLLLQEWTTGLRLTTIPQAMARLGIKDDLRLRWRVASRLEGIWRDALTSPEKLRQIASALGRPYDETQLEGWRQQVGTWSLASVILSENEKLTARYILRHYRQGDPLPPPATIAKALRIPTREVLRALRALGRLGFLSLPNLPSLSNYGLADGHERFLKGLGFFFHTVTLDSGECFGVP